ncbi:hypothetical protein [Acetobacter oeni]|uniref:Uncharacterized protein n=1 Tax=Acetobacter oeni TaxID=304077 RepID=A0A511XIK5_9PROT|nr:hypothetical protein [Acetobacter oeni]MBB3881894.1 hypothetical protein [Acetobacter oeni]NHO17782.1 hypothetical protein [Acetobacter oeni]GBR02475.1 hypothetical protein AA21952_0760 [Acetobacter oeni LMG 21952]GEN62788.1 hypothetical protein AOE01nite_10120 [Acetobacter oeni]
MKKPARFVIGLGVPLVAVMGMIPFVSCFGKTLLGVPTIIVATGSLFFIASASMAACWVLFDRAEVS